MPGPLTLQWERTVPKNLLRKALKLFPLKVPVVVMHRMLVRVRPKVWLTVAWPPKCLEKSITLGCMNILVWSTGPPSRTFLSEA